MNKNCLGEGAFFGHQGGGVQTKILGKKIGTLKAGGGKKIGPLARIYTPGLTTTFKEVFHDKNIEI